MNYTKALVKWFNLNIVFKFQAQYWDQNFSLLNFNFKLVFIKKFSGRKSFGNELFIFVIKSCLIRRYYSFYFFSKMFSKSQKKKKLKFCKPAPLNTPTCTITFSLDYIEKIIKINRHVVRDSKATIIFSCVP